MNTKHKVDFIRAHPEQYTNLTINTDSYASVNVASFNKVLHNGMLQFKGWTGNSNGVWNVGLESSDRLDSLYEQMVKLIS